MDDSKNVGEMIHISKLLTKFEDPAFLREENIAILDDQIDEDYKQVEERAFLQNLDPSQISQTQFSW